MSDVLTVVLPQPLRAAARSAAVSKQVMNRNFLIFRLLFSLSFPAFSDAGSASNIW
jgi:hypothetical protein